MSKYPVVITVSAELALADGETGRRRAAGTLPGAVIASSAMTRAETSPPTVERTSAKPVVKLSAVRLEQPGVARHLATEIAKTTAAAYKPRRINAIIAPKKALIAPP
jgi:hypothetical protein